MARQIIVHVRLILTCEDSDADVIADALDQAPMAEALENGSALGLGETVYLATDDEEAGDVDGEIAYTFDEFTVISAELLPVGQSV